MNLFRLPPRHQLAFYLAAAVLAATAGCAQEPADGTGPEGPADEITYLTSFGLFGRDAYAHVAAAKGFFAEQGLEVEIRPGTGTDGVKFVSAGKAHFAAVDFSGGLLQVARADLDVRAVALIQQKSLAAIMATTGSGIHRPSDLAGRKIADIPASVVKLLFPTYAKLAGLDPATVTFINSNPQSLIATLNTAGIDAISQFVVGQPTVAAVTGRPVVVLPYSDYLADLPGNALWTSGDLLRGNPGLVERFRTALLKGLRYALDHPDEAGVILARANPAADPRLAAQELVLMRPYAEAEPLGRIDGARIARAIAILQAAGAVPAGLTPERLVTDVRSTHPT